MAQRRISRRRFLALCVVSAGAASAGAIKLLEGDEKRHPHEELTRAVGAAFGDLDSLKGVGEAYLRSHTGEADERRLVRLLRASSPRWSSASGPADVRRVARVQVRHDYAAGRLAVAEGWYLSQTEARLCALATFS